MMTRVILVSCLLLGLLMGSVPCLAQFVSIKPIPSGFAENPPYGQIVREIRVEGNKHTREYIIRSAFKSEVGYPYTPEDAKKDMLWIARLGSFLSVSFRTEPVKDGIALIVTVVEGTPYIPSLSIKLTQENGLEIGPSISSSNLLGTAARASAYARFGGATNIGVRYADPLLPGKSLLWGYRLQYFHRERTNELLNYQETSDEFYFEFRNSTSDEMRTGLRFQYISLHADRDSITLNPSNNDKVPSLGVFVQQDSRNGIYPTNGWFMDLEIAKYGLFGGDGDYWRLDLDVRRYLRLPKLGDRHSLALSSFATLVNGELGSTIPTWSEFFIGGTNSVRGWSLGSRQGQNQWLNTAEYWFRLMKQKKWKFWFIRWRMGFQLGLLGDLGTAWSETEDLEKNWLGGVGAGFRLTLPVITMIRFDVAYGEEGTDVRLFVGGAEKAIAQKGRVR